MTKKTETPELIPSGRSEEVQLKKDPDSRLFVSTYSEETKDRAVQIYLLTGSAVKTAQILQVPKRTVQSWLQTDWFQHRYQEAKRKYNLKLDGAFSALLRQMVKQLEDRILNGDEVLDREGNLIRRAVPAKDLSAMLGNIFKTLALLRGEPTSYTKKVTIEDKLNTIAEEIRKKRDERDGKPDTVH